MIEFRIKEKTRSLNQSFRGNYAPRAAITKRQRTKAMQACPRWPGGPLLVVRLTRVSPGVLDFANLAGALKPIQDGVASRLKVDDASPLVEWIFAQATGAAEVVVQIWRDGEDSPPLPVGSPVERKRPLLPSERVSKALRATAPAVLATVAADAGKRLRVVREPGKGEKRVPRPAYEAPRNVDERRALRAAREAEATFAPAPVPPCDNCGEAYRAKCFDPKAPPGSVKCRKDVHCYRFDGHDDECASRARSCTT